MDRRLLPANNRVALTSWAHVIDAPRYVDGTARQIVVPVADLRPAPASEKRDCQLIYGAEVLVLDEYEGWAFVQAGADGYVGYVHSGAVGDAIAATHVVAVLASHAYARPDLKSPDVMALSHGSRLRVVSASGAFFETAEGWFVPKPHLRPANAPMRDPATLAQMYFGVPYLWGGNSASGIDCSGLVQVACRACGIAAPRDSDMQADQLGDLLGADVALGRGDLVFWRGHVGMMVDDRVMIHANAHTMSVAYEPLDAAIQRIADQGEGGMTARRRIIATAQP